MNKKYQIDMTSGHFFKRMTQFVIPLILTGILQLIYNAADLIVVSNFSDEANAIGAVGSTSAIINLILNLSMGLAVGTNVLASKFFPLNDEDKMQKLMHASIFLGVTIGIICGAIGIIFADEFMEIMSNPIPLATVYLRIYFIGVPFNLTYNFLAGILTGAGDTKRPLIILSVSGVINVILNLFFCIVLKLGVRGVALATIISQAVSCILIYIVFTKLKGILKLNPKEFKLDKYVIQEIFRIGLPAGIESSLFSISNLIIQSSINEFGALAIDGNSAAASIQGFIYVGLNAMYSATVSFTAQNIAVKKYENINKVFFNGLILVTIIGIIGGGGSYLLRYPLLKIYIDNETSIAVGSDHLQLITLPYFIFGITKVFMGSLRGMNHNIIPMSESLFCICVFRLIWIYGVFKPIRDVNNLSDLRLLYVSYVISWILLIIMNVITYYIVLKHTLKAHKKEELLLN